MSGGEAHGTTNVFDGCGETRVFQGRQGVSGVDGEEAVGIEIVGKGIHDRWIAGHPATPVDENHSRERSIPFGNSDLGVDLSRLQ
jgi:hypothetical protein